MLLLLAHDSKFDHVLAHSVEIGYNFLVDDCFGKFSLLQHFFQHLILFS